MIYKSKKLLAMTLSAFVSASSFAGTMIVDNESIYNSLKDGDKEELVVSYYTLDSKIEDYKELRELGEYVKDLKVYFSETKFTNEFYTYEELYQVLGGKNNHKLNSDFKEKYDAYTKNVKEAQTIILNHPQYKAAIQPYKEKYEAVKAEMAELAQKEKDMEKPFADLRIPLTKLEETLAALEKENAAINKELTEYVYSKVGEDSKVKERDIIKPKLKGKACKQEGYVTKEKKKDGKYYVQLENDYCVELPFVKKIKKPLSEEIIAEDKFKELIDKQMVFAQKAYQDLGVWKLRKEERKETLKKRIKEEKSKYGMASYKLGQEMGISPKTIKQQKDSLQRQYETAEIEYNRSKRTNSKSSGIGFSTLKSKVQVTNKNFGYALEEAVDVAYWAISQDVRVDKKTKYNLHEVDEDTKYMLLSWERKDKNGGVRFWWGRISPKALKEYSFEEHEVYKAKEIAKNPNMPYEYSSDSSMYHSDKLSKKRKAQDVRAIFFGSHVKSLLTQLDKEAEKAKYK